MEVQKEKATNTSNAYDQKITEQQREEINKLNEENARLKQEYRDVVALLEIEKSRAEKSTPVSKV